MLIISVRPAVATPFHILLIVVDDLGWSDVGFHNPQINTPNIDHLASKGVILDNYYVQPTCTSVAITEHTCSSVTQISKAKTQSFLALNNLF